MQRQKCKLIGLMIVSMLFAHCSLEKQPSPIKPEQSASAIQAAQHPLLITFSKTNKDTDRFFLYTLGLIDLLIDIKLPSGEIVSLSVLPTQPSIPHQQSAKLLDFTALKDKQALFVGWAIVPQGQIISLQWIFSPFNTHIATHTYNLKLSNSFNQPLNPEKTVEKTTLPALYTTLALEHTIQKEEEALWLNAEFNLANSIITESLFDTQAAFIPDIKAQLTPIANELAINLHINEKTWVQTEADQLNVHYSDPIAFTTQKTEGATLSLNGQSLKQFDDIKGHHWLSLTGTYRPATNTLSINEGLLFSLSDNHNQSIRLHSAKESALVADLPLSLAQQLVIDIEDNRPTPAFDLTPEKDKITSSPEEIDNSLRLQQPLLLTGDALSDITVSDQAISWQLSPPIFCEALTHLNGCTQPLESITLRLDTAGDYSLIITRQGVIEEALNNALWVTPESDLITHHQKANDLAMALAAQIEQGNRIALLATQGTLDGNQFQIQDALKIITLSPQNLIDEEVDELLTESEEAPTWRSLSTGLVSFAAVSAAALTGIALYSTLKYKPAFLQSLYSKLNRVKWQSPASDPAFHTNKEGYLEPSDNQQPKQGQLIRQPVLSTPIQTVQDNLTTQPSQGIKFSFNNQTYKLTKALLKDRTVDLTLPQNHPLFEPGTGAYFLPKTPEQIANQSPADTLFFPDFALKDSALPSPKSKSPPKDINNLHDRTLTMKLGENIKSLISSDGTAIEKPLLDLLKQSEWDFQHRQAQHQQTVQEATQAFRQKSISITEFKLKTQPIKRPNLIKK